MARAIFGLVALLGLCRDGLALPTPDNHDAPTVRWIGETPKYSSGVTFGAPWPQGRLYPNETSFSVSGSGKQLPSDSWITAYWRDGSIKWTGHALPATEDAEEHYTVHVSRAEGPKGDISIQESSSDVTVSTGKITASFPKEGNFLVSSIKTSGGKTIGKNGRLVLHSQSAVSDNIETRPDLAVEYFNFESNIEDVEVTRDSSVRALVTVRGKFQVSSAGKHDDWLPFVVRFYLYSGSEAIRIIHSIVFDGRQEKDFISALGLRLEVPLKEEELYNRHIRLAGADGGFLNEAVKGITGLRRDPGQEVRAAQVAGKETPDISTWDERVSSRMHWIPTWNDFKLRQLSSDAFSIKKRTKPGYTWLDVAAGTKSGGLAYLGGATVGGLAVGLRDFWKQHPTGLDVSASGSDTGELTLWLYSPDAEPLDLRPFHDGMGQDTYEKQLDALEITYEDYEPGFDTPYGIAKTSEIYLYGFESTPSSDRLALLNGHLNNPPALAAEPTYLRDTQALGSYWDTPDTSNEQTSTIEQHLDFLNEFYQRQTSDRRFYGFLNYGDFMHSYDADRHTWKYDIGGYAWDNSELSPDLFFWQYFLRTGRADVYRFAEALTRHTGEVDTYHLGDWKGLGTRHGVLHFADSAKQARIAQPQYRRYFFYLSGGDERVGEVLDEMIDADKVYGVLDPQRKVREDGWTPEPGEPASVSLGTDWAGLAAGWLLAWERRGPRWEEARDKLTRTAAGIANLTNGFVTGSGLYDIDTRTLLPPFEDPDNEGLVAVSHLSAVFGLPEVVSEALEYWGEEAPEGFRDAWLDYCYYYGATAAEQEERYGEPFGRTSLIQGHSRLSAYYYSQGLNDTVGLRAWTEFFESDGFSPDDPWTSVLVDNSSVPMPVHEAAFVSTNDVAQYGLASIQNLALARKALDSYEPSE